MGTIEKLKSLNLIDFAIQNLSHSKKKDFKNYMLFSPAPCCGTEKGFMVHPEYFKCHSCGKGGSIIDLEMMISGSDTGKAIKKLADEFGIVEEKQAPEKKIESPILKAAKKARPISIEQAKRYIRSRKFPDDAAESASKILFSEGVLVSHKRNIECLFIPVIQAGKLSSKEIDPGWIVTAQYISIDKKCFPSITVGGKTYPALETDKVFLGGESSKGAYFFDKGGDQIIVVESFANALSLASCGYSAICIFNTGNLDLSLRIKEVFPGKEIILWMDRGVEEKQLEFCKKASLLGIWYNENDKKGLDVNDVLSRAGSVENFKADVRRYLSKKTSAPSWWTIEEIESVEADSQRPEIIIEGGKLHRMVDQAEKALIDGKADIYQRCGSLVCASEIVVSGKKTPSIFPLKQEHLIEELTRLADWKKFSPKGGYFSCDCPVPVAQSLMARPQWKLPYLTGIIDTPTIRRDGTVLHIEGFDRETGILYRPQNGMFSDVMKELENPSYDDAIKAEREIYKIFCEFPFKELHDYSVVLSAVLSSLIRFSLKTVPIHGFSASKMSSGKTLLADSVSYFASGTPCPVITQAKNSEEESKRMLAIIKEGPRTVSIDNIERPLEGEALCTILTQESWRERVLGTNTTATVPTNSTLWMATGNNLQFRGDLSTRALVAYLLPREERPEERKFSVNLHEVIPRRREELVICALKILRAYDLAGRPNVGNFSPFGRFEEWSERVRGAIIWLGLKDPCLSRKSVEENDTHRDELTNLLNCWHDVFGEKEHTITKAIDQSSFYGDENMDLLQCFTDIAEEYGKISKRKLGCFFRNNEGRIEGGFQLQRAGKGKSGMRWRVVKIT